MERSRLESVRITIIKNFLIVVISIILVLNLFIMFILRQYYYQSRGNTIENQIKLCVDFYKNDNLNEDDIINNVYNSISIFWNNENNYVEFIDNNKKLVKYPKNIDNYNFSNFSNLDKVMDGKIDKIITKTDYFNEESIIISYPLINSNNKVIGVIRVISSLKDLAQDINLISILIILISIIIIIFGTISNLVMSKSIVNPLNNLIELTEQIANGNLLFKINDDLDNIETYKLSNNLNYMASEIKKREQLKNDFISSVSHELRTPLTAIKGWVITINYDLSDIDTLKLGLNIIENETDRLTVMVEELLDLSKLVSGIIQIKKSKVDIKNFVNHIEDYMMPRANMDNLKFGIDIQEDIGYSYFDYNKMKQVLLNVIDNSFKFSEEGGSILLKVEKEDIFTKFIIIDNGSGISQSDLLRVKEKFYKGKNSKSKNGIGLSICDEIVKLHQGSFTIESKLGKGTIVTIILNNNINS